MAEHARQAGGQQAPPGPLSRLDNVLGHRTLVPAVKKVDRRPHPRIGVVPADPGRTRQRRRDGHAGKLGHQPGEHLSAAPGYVQRVPPQYFAAGPEFLGVHGQRTDTDHRRERPGTCKPALGQPGLRRDTRSGPAVVGARLDHDVPATGQPQTEHHRDLMRLEQHAGGFAAQMVTTPSR
ncbi:hypothetical protein OG470_21590 [Micromonospora sp. NBC_00389]|uniref:hypothetical protein n=1 Tax=Micromonospora sp. NBC_00389 TaxID=2903586 RepID=UPI002E1FB4ED